MKLTLYYAPIACSLVPLVTLHESGAEFEVKPISLKNKQQHNSDYLRINPKAKAPKRPSVPEFKRLLRDWFATALNRGNYERILTPTKRPGPRHLSR